jgi:hypothetical protein
MIPVVWEKDSGQIIQTVHPSNFVVVYFNLGTWNVSHPCLSYQNSPSFGVGRFWMMLKYSVFDRLCL